jgi:predicted transcriptional regulator
MTDTTASGNYIELTAEIVSAYVSNNTVSASEIPGLISQVHAALSRVSAKTGDVAAEPPKPAVSVKKSITPEHIVCL